MQPIFFTVSTISRQPRMLVFGLPSRYEFFFGPREKCVLGTEFEYSEPHSVAEYHTGLRL